MILLKVSLFNSSSALFRFFQPSLLKTCHMRYKLVLNDRFLANPRTDRDITGDSVKKKILLVVLASFMVMGVASAASLWGTYKGKQIIRLTVNGNPVSVTDAPAVIMDNRTMIPIYLLKDAGVKYVWDSKNQTVNIVQDEQGKYNKQYASVAQKYNDLIADAEFFLDFSYTLEFYYEANLRSSTSKSADDLLRTKMEEVRTRYSDSVKENDSISAKIQPLTLTRVYEIQNDLHASAENFVKAFEQLMIWKYALDQKDGYTDSTSKQAAQITADKALTEYDKFAAEAQRFANLVKDKADQTHNIVLNEIR